jgi:hypothetical protein
MLINSPNISGSLKVSGNAVITGSLTTSIAALNSAATTFLTSNNGTIRSRTAAQTLSDIGAQPAGFTWFDYIVGKTTVIETAISGGVVQELSYSGSAEKRYRFISNPYSSSLDIIYTTFSSGSVSNPVAYKLITL